MKASIETLEDVDREYGPIVGKAVTTLATTTNPDAALEDLVDPVVEAIEATMHALGFGFRRKEGF